MAYMYAEEMELLIAQHELEQMNDGITNLMAIHDHITKFGVSDALKDLVGPSLEELTGATIADKPSLIQRILAGVKKMFARVFGMFKKIYGWIKSKLLRFVHLIKSKILDFLAPTSYNLTKEQVSNLKLNFDPEDCLKFVESISGAIKEVSHRIEELMRVPAVISEVDAIISKETPAIANTNILLKKLKDSMESGKEVSGGILISKTNKMALVFNTTIETVHTTLSDVDSEINRCYTSTSAVIESMERELKSGNVSDDDSIDMSKRLKALRMVAQEVARLGTMCSGYWSTAIGCSQALYKLSHKIRKFQYSNLKTEEERKEYREKYNYNPTEDTEE